MSKKSEIQIQRNLLETMINAWIEDGLKPSLILCALHNACIHGERLEHAGWHVTEENLEQLFKGFDLSLNAFSSMEK